MSIGNFINRVLKITDPQAALAFYEAEVAYMREKHPEIVDPEKVLRSNIGWCFGEGMDVPRRQMWRDVCGAEHPVGPEYAEREFTASEMLQAGMRLAEKHRREREYPSAWDLVLRERFSD